MAWQCLEEGKCCIKKVHDTNNCSEIFALEQNSFYLKGRRFLFSLNLISLSFKTKMFMYITLTHMKNISDLSRAETSNIHIIPPPKKAKP